MVFVVSRCRVDVIPFVGWFSNDFLHPASTNRATDCLPVRPSVRSAQRTREAPVLHLDCFRPFALSTLDTANEPDMDPGSTAGMRDSFQLELTIRTGNLDLVE